MQHEIGEANIKCVVCTKTVGTIVDAETSVEEIVRRRLRCESGQRGARDKWGRGDECGEESKCELQRHTAVASVRRTTLN